MYSPLKTNSSLMKTYLVLLALLLSSSAIGQTVVPRMMRDDERRAAAEAYADSVLRTLTPRQQAAQLIMPMTWPRVDAKGIATWRRQVTEGEFGCVLWQKGRPEDVVRLVNIMRREARVPMLVAMDGEWGLSMRLSGTMRWPRNMLLGATNDPRLAYEYGKATAEEARRIGIHVNFAPVLDVNSNPANPVIGTRSLGSDPELVIRLGLAYAKGLEDGGILSTAKHFPGHGDTSTDSHKTLPVIKRSREELEQVELPPFRAYISEGFGGIMVGHLSVPALGTGSKATSAVPAVVTGLLQEEMGFGGLIFTDGLGMKGIVNGAGQHGVYVTTLLAGADVLVAPTDPFDALEDITTAVSKGVISQEEITRRCRKVLIWKHLLGADLREEISTAGLQSDLHPESSQDLLRRIYEGAMTLVKDENRLLPLRKGDRVALLTYGDDSTEVLRSELSKEVSVDSYTIRRSTGVAARKSILRKLRGYDRVVVAITWKGFRPQSDLTALLKETRSILLFHTSPYAALDFTEAMKAADVVAFAYDTRSEGMRAMSAALTGQLPFTGRLSVDLPPLLRSGDGISRKAAD